MKPIFILLLSISAIYKVKAQDTIRTARSDQPYNAVKLGFTTVSAFIPMVQLGVEHRWQKYSCLAGAGFVIPRRYNIDNTIKGIAQGYSLRVEGRCHNYTPSHSGLYLGAALFFTWFKYPRTGDFTDTSSGTPYNFIENDNYLLRKTIIGGIVKFGGHHYIGKHLDIDMSIGAGPKWVVTTQQGRTYPDSYEYIRHPDIYKIEGEVGTRVIPAIQAQISIAYLLGQ